jgi:hypothetical protein
MISLSIARAGRSDKTNFSTFKISIPELRLDDNMGSLIVVQKPSPLGDTSYLFEALISHRLGNRLRIFLNNHFIKVIELGSGETREALPLLPTVPLLQAAAPQSVCCVGLTALEISMLQKECMQNIFFSITISENFSDWRIRNIVRECEESDIVYISDRLLERPESALLAGLIMGKSDRPVFVIPGEGDFVSQLRDQGIIR